MESFFCDSDPPNFVVVSKPRQSLDQSSSKIAGCSMTYKPGQMVNNLRRCREWGQRPSGLEQSTAYRSTPESRVWNWPFVAEANGR